MNIVGSTLNVDIAEFTTSNAFALTIASGDEATIGFFNQLGFEGNGYTWDGILSTLARMKFSERLDELSFSPEAESALVHCRDPMLIEALATELRAICGNKSEMLRLIQSATRGYLSSLQ